MKLKKHYLRVISELGDLSQDLVISSTWTKDGFIDAEYRAWLRSVNRFLRLLLKHDPSDLILK